MKMPKKNKNLPDENHQTALRQRLIAGYLANAESDSLMAEKWWSIEEEVWLNILDNCS